MKWHVEQDHVYYYVVCTKGESRHVHTIIKKVWERSINQRALLGLTIIQMKRTML